MFEYSYIKTVDKKRLKETAAKFSSIGVWFKRNEGGCQK